LNLKSNTPILDLLESVPVPKGAFGLKQWQSGALFLGTLLGIMLFLAVLTTINSANHVLTSFERSLEHVLHPLDGFNLPQIVLAFILAQLVAIILHELGHVFAGLVVGFKFKAIQTGPIFISRENRKFKVRFLYSSGGLTFMHIPSLRRLHKKLSAYIASGPTVNLLTIFLCIECLTLTSLALTLRMGITVLMITSMFAFLGSILPMRYRSGLFSDGAKLKMLLCPGAKTWRMYSIFALELQQKRGVSPRAWNKRWLKNASYCWDDSRDALSGAWLAYISANSHKNSTEAAAFLEQCLRGTNVKRNEINDLIATEAGVFHSWFRNDPVKSKEWFSKVRNANKMPPIMRARADVAREFALGNYSQALLHWNEGLRIIQEMADSIQRRNAESSWREWKEEMEVRQFAVAACSVP
jgi:hypothetical protein